MTQKTQHTRNDQEKGSLRNNTIPLGFTVLQKSKAKGMKTIFIIIAIRPRPANFGANVLKKNEGILPNSRPSSAVLSDSG